MGTLDPRDRSLEQLLRQSSSVSSVSDGCLDAETLAAWAERTLPTASATTVEQHLADCARCQALLAAFVRSEPLDAHAAPDHTRWWHLRWLVPLATAATAAAVWVAIPSDRQRDFTSPAKQESATARFEPSYESAPPIPSPPAVVEEKAVPEPAQGRRSKSDLAERDADQRNQEPLGQVGATKATGDAARKTREESSGRTDSATTFRAELPAGAAPAAPRAAAAPSPPTPANVTPLGEPQRQAGADEQRAAERPREAAAKAATAPPPASLVMMSREAATVAFSAPDGSRRWRIVSGTRVERSSDGVVWEMVPMPAPGSLVNGHAPSASVAWVVGRAGTIFLTSDGGRFEPVPFPEAVDLSTVVAIDDRQASVTTADGRTFVTSDRGANWRRQ